MACSSQPNETDELKLLQLNNLNDDCLVLILDAIPLSELIPLELVCIRWRILVRIVCVGVRQLTLVAPEAVYVEAPVIDQPHIPRFHMLSNFQNRFRDVSRSILFGPLQPPTGPPEPQHGHFHLNLHPRHQHHGFFNNAPHLDVFIRRVYTEQHDHQVLHKYHRDRSCALRPKVYKCYIPISLVYQLYTRYGIEFQQPGVRVQINHRLTVEMAQAILVRFPNITRFEVIENRLDLIVDPLCGILFENWSNQLVALKIVTSGPLFNLKPALNYQEAWPKLQEGVKKCSKLRHLVLFDKSHRVPFLDFSTLKSLERCYVNYESRSVASIFKFIQDHLPSVRDFGILENDLAFHYTPGPSTPDTQADAPPPPQSLTKLTIPDSGTAHGFLQQLPQVLPHFHRSLTSLRISSNTIYKYSFNLPFLLPKLVKLVNLSSLRLTYIPSLFHPISEEQMKRLPCLAALKTLHLDCFVLPHQEFERAKLVFPNLVTIKVDGNQVGACWNHFNQLKVPKPCQKPVKEEEEDVDLDKNGSEDDPNPDFLTTCEQVFLSACRKFEHLTKIYLMKRPKEYQPVKVNNGSGSQVESESQKECEEKEIKQTEGIPKDQVSSHPPGGGQESATSGTGRDFLVYEHNQFPEWKSHFFEFFDIMARVFFT